MGRMEWSSLTRVLAVIVAASFFIGTVMFVLLNFGFLGEPPAPPEVHTPEDRIAGILAEWDFENARWPIDFASTSLFAIGFGALALLGQGLARLGDEDDPRGRLIAIAFVLAGGLGVASQLLWLGVKPLATSTQYCECGLVAEEIMSRLMILNITSGIQFWLVNGAVAAVALGLVAAAPIGREAGMGTGWSWFSWLLAAGFVVGIVIGVIEGVIGGFEVPVGALITALIAGILVPAWAIWLALRSPDLEWEAPGEAPEVSPAL